MTARFRKGVTYEGDTITKCVFCDIAAQDGKSRCSRVFAFSPGETYRRRSNDIHTAFHNTLACQLPHAPGPSGSQEVLELLKGCSKKEVQPLLHKDDVCAAFWTRSPECAWHLLVVPLEHIQTVDDMIDQAAETSNNQQDRIELLKASERVRLRFVSHRSTAKVLGHLHNLIVQLPSKMYAASFMLT